MQSVLRVVHSLAQKIKNQSVNMELSMKSTETPNTPLIVLKGTFSQDDLKSLYLSRLWRVETGIEDNQFKIMLYPVFKDVPEDGGLFDDEELLLLDDAAEDVVNDGK